ncbi:MAG: RagB/SusD family nutrient uptake outer membrane protein [Bacteroides sp.]|nr:RagB/SusD family nutrient uptake outer membrane protein [Bacteroides sp.]
MKTTIFSSLMGKLILLCSLFALTGCDNFLDITPPSQVAPENYLLEESQLAAYTIRYYQEMFPTINNLYGGDMATDNATTKGSNDRYLPGKWKTPANDGEWDFKHIYAMNYYLGTVVPRLEEGILTGNTANLKHYVGEGYFLRAYQYFYRLRKLGDFPIVTSVLPDEQEVLTEASQRKPRNKVARFILKDLDEAIELLSNNPPGGKARITRNAALVLKARVALFEATWEKYHAGTAMVPNGPGWPGKDKDYNQSYNFPGGSLEGEIHFFLEEAMKAAEQVADAIPLEENNGVIRESLSDPVNTYYDMFASTAPDAYAEVLMYRPYAPELNIGSDYNHHIYYGYQRGYTHQMEQSFLMNNGLPVYAPGSGYAGDDYIADTKIDRDDRWRLFMKAPGEVKTFINTGNIEYFDEAPMVYSADIKYSTATGYMIGKGFSHDLANQILNKDATAPILFRAGEAYLVYLEAYYEKNGKVEGKADLYWRTLRRRAGVDPDYTKTIAATDMEKEKEVDWGSYSHGKLVDKTLYNIRRERRCEFIGEGYRYDDLIRWRAMDQLDGFQIEGFKLFGPSQALYDPADLIYDVDNQSNTVSSPTKSLYIRPYQVSTGNDFYNGLFFIQAHYLSPIAVKHFLITASDGETISTSPIYQNPGWSTVAQEGAQ